jgi:opacity protein-like surface antigen
MSYNAEPRLARLTLAIILGLLGALISTEARAGTGLPEPESLHDWPRIVVGVDLGVAKMVESGPFGFNNGVGSVTGAGASWGARAGVEFFDWLAVEARYSGSRTSVHASAAPAGSLAFVSTAADLTLRLSAPLPWVHPYIFGGMGYNQVSLAGSTEARAGSPLHSSGQTEIAMGFGVDVPLTWRLSVGFEATYHFQLSEDFSEDMTNGIDGGDISTFNALVRARF